MAAPERELAPGSAAWTIHTDVFDGPLDLLLYLVQRDGIDLRRLDVRQVTDSYLAYLDRMRELNLSLAGDYLVMAATLVHLKSLELLPRLPTVVEELEEDPRDALARQLREYAKVRARADALDARPLLGREVFTRDAAAVGGEPALEAGIDAFALLDLYWGLLARSAERDPVVELAPSGVDFRSCCRIVLDALGGKGGRGELGAMLRSLHARSQRVVTFIAVLEMARQQWLAVSQEVHLGPIALEQLVDDGAIDLNLLSSWVDEDADDDGEADGGPEAGDASA